MSVGGVVDFKKDGKCTFSWFFGTHLKFCVKVQQLIIGTDVLLNALMEIRKSISD